MLKKLSGFAAASILAFALSGCSVFSVDDGVLSFTTSAQTKITDVFGQGDKDLVLAEQLSAAEALNVPQVSQCIPVFKDWYDSTAAKIVLLNKAGLAGPASTVTVATWAKDTISAGVPANVQLACGALAQKLDVDVTDVVSLVKAIAVK